MKVKDIEFLSPVVLAPLAGITDLPFRRICRSFGAGMVTSEMVSAKALVHGNEATRRLLRTDNGERPSVVQIFGSCPETMAQAAEILNNSPFEILDINMGCPAPKIVKNGDGSALMRDPALAGRIVRAVKAVSHKPVTCKIRLGWDGTSINCVEYAKIIEDAGADAIAVHGRTRSQMYAGLADWSWIKKVKEAVSVPVTGNGDVANPEQAKKLMEETGVDALMIGRATYGDPWIFKHITTYLATGELLPAPTPSEKIAMSLHHAKMAVEHDGEKVALREMRKHFSWYVKGLREATEAKVAINKAESFNQVEEILRELEVKQ
ncbi:MAG: tRNA dihydrouridine synthase DusB [Defluviitaleaceae bacterium]|nr:tRNA dihydrouridine synthase DusB [Defluviitaleaceae bacterium]